MTTPSFSKALVADCVELVFQHSLPRNNEAARRVVKRILGVLGRSQRLPIFVGLAHETTTLDRLGPRLSCPIPIPPTSGQPRSSCFGTDAQHSIGPIRLAQRATDSMPWVLTHGKHRPPTLFSNLGGPAVARTAKIGKAFSFICSVDSRRRLRICRPPGSKHVGGASRQQDERLDDFRYFSWLASNWRPVTVRPIFPKVRIIRI